MGLQLGNFCFQVVLQDLFLRLAFGLGFVFHHLSNPLHMHFQFVFQILQVGLVLFALTSHRLLEFLALAFQLSGIRDETLHQIFKTMDQLGGCLALLQIAVQAVQMIGAVRQELTHRIVTQPFGKLLPGVQRALATQPTPRTGRNARSTPFQAIVSSHTTRRDFWFQEFTKTQTEILQTINPTPNIESIFSFDSFIFGKDLVMFT